MAPVTKSTRKRWEDLCAGESGWLPRKARFSAPLQKRIEQLYVYGYNSEAITAMVINEFQDVEAFPISHTTVHEIIQKNFQTLEGVRDEYLQELSSSIIEDMKVLLQKGAESDNKTVQMLIQKEEEIYLRCTDLNITEMDENGKPTNLYMFSAYLDALERVNKLKSKLTGMDAFREFDLYKKKEELKASLGAIDLIPDVKKNGRPINMAKSIDMKS